MYGCWIMHEITLIGWPVTSGRDYQAITSACGATVPTIIPMLLSNAQILWRGHATAAVDRDPKTRLRNAIATACCPSVPFKALSFCSMCHEQLSLSHRPSLQSLTSVVVGEMLRQSETYLMTHLQQVGARLGDEKLFTSDFLTDAKPLLSM